MMQERWSGQNTDLMEESEIENVSSVDRNVFSSDGT